MDTNNKEESLLTLLQALDETRYDMNNIAKDLDSEQKDLLNSVTDTVLRARAVVQEVLMRDKKDVLLLNYLQDEFTQVLDFLSGKRLMSEYIRHKRKKRED